MRIFTVSAQIIGLAAWLAITFFAAAVGAVASIDASSFYTQLAQPAWAPPPSVFGPVSTVLYVAMAVAAWLVWRIDVYRAAPLGADNVPGSTGAQLRDVATQPREPGLIWP